MDIIFDLGTLLDIFKHYGTFFGMLTLLVMFLVKYIINNFSKWVSVDKPPEKSVDNDREFLRSNSFFTNAQYRMMIEIPRLELINKKPVREKVFKDLLVISFQTVYNAMHELVENQALNDWTAEQWADLVTQSINKISINTEEQAKAATIPDVVIRKFSKWYSETIEMLHEYILLLANSKLYDTNFAKTNTLLLIMDLLLVSILGDVERVISEINGELTGLVYKGLTIE